MKLKASRMETLIDGIFAIVMTVMVITLSEVLNFSKPMNNSDFHKLFLSLGLDFFTYVVSFLILGILWFEHHWQFHYIRFIDPVLVFINVVWLIFLCLIPFTTMLLGNHPKFLAPELFFEFNILIVFLILHIHWVYATHQGRLMELTSEAKKVSKRRDVCLFPIIITLLAIISSLLNNSLKK